jgi:hypothetical protein
MTPAAVGGGGRCRLRCFTPQRKPQKSSQELVGQHDRRAHDRIGAEE